MISAVAAAKKLEAEATDKLTEAEMRNALVSQGYSEKTAKSVAASYANATAKGVEATSFNTLTTSILGSIKAFWAFLTTTPAGWATLAIGAVVGLIAAYDGLTTSTEEYKEKLSDLKSELDGLTSDIKNYENQLTSIRDRLKELSSIGEDNMTFSEKEEYDNLVKQNNELQRKIDLLKTEEKIKQKETNDTFVDTMESDSKAGQVKKLLEAREHFLEEYRNSSTEEDKEYNKKTLEAIDEDLKEYSDLISDWSETSEGISYISKPTTEDEKAVNEWLDFISDFQDKIAIDNDGENAKTNAFNRLIDNWKYDDTVQELQDLGEEGKVTADILTDPKYINNSKYNDFVDNLVEIGVIDSADNLDEIALAFNNLAKQTEYANKSLEDTLTNVDRLSKVQSLSTGLDQLDAIYADVKNGKEFDYSSILNNEDFIKTFSGYEEEYNNFIETISKSPKDIKKCQDAFDNLATAYIDEKGVLTNVTEETKTATITMLKQMGVVNAEEVVMKRLNAEKEYATKTSKDLSDATAKDINSFLKETDVAQETKNQIVAYYLEKQLANGITLNTSNDVANLQNLISALGGATGALDIYYKALNGTLNVADVSGMGGGDAKYIKQMALVQAQEEIKKINANLDKYKIEYGGGTKTKEETEKSSKSKESFDWIQVKIERLEREISNLDRIVNATYKSWADRNKALSDEMSKVTDEIAVQEAGYKKYMELANGVGLSDKYKNLVQSGAIDYSTISDEGLAEKIKKYQEFYELALACKDKTSELRDELANLAKLSFDNVVSEYEDKLSAIEHETSVLEAYISQTEARGHIVSKSYYEELIDVEKNNLSTLRAEYASLQTALEQAVANGDIKEGSSEWYAMMSSINDVELAIINSNTQIIEFQKNIRDLEWENFDRLRDMIAQVSDEADFLIELMSDEDLFNENGSITEYGQSTFGLHLSNLYTYQDEANAYAKEIEEINKELANDPYNVDLLERREELINSHQDMILAAQDERQSMIDLAEEGYNKMLDYLGKLIDKRKELLNLEKSSYDYQKTIDEATSEIARLEKIGQALAGDTSEEGQLRKQQNAKELEEARKNLEETQYDKWHEDQQSMLDNLQNSAQEWVDERLENPEQLLADIASATEKNAQTISETLQSEAEKVGYKLSDTMLGIWTDGGTQNSVVTELQEIENFLAEMIKASDKEAKEGMSDNAGGQNNSSSSNSGSGSTGGSNSGGSTSNQNSSNSNKNSGSSWGSWFISKKDNTSHSKLDIENSIVDRLKYKDFDSSFDARAKYYEAMGLGKASSYTGSSKQNQAMLKLMKQNKFQKGGYIGSLVKSTGEDGFILANKGEYVLSQEKLEILSRALMNAQPLINSFSKPMPINSNGLGNTITNDVEMNISMYGVQDVQGLVTELQKDNRFQKIVQQMTVGTMAGGNKLGKYKY